MSADMEKIRIVTEKHYRLAKKSLEFIIKESKELHHFDAISDVIPGFSAEKLEFGSCDKENFAVLFVDMRNSTKRAQNVGAGKNIPDNAYFSHCLA